MTDDGPTASLDERLRAASQEAREHHALLSEAAFEISQLRKCLVAHHDIATLSAAVLSEHDWRGCPVCQKATA